MLKPFRPPLLNKDAPSRVSNSSHPDSPPSKRRRLDIDSDERKPESRLIFKNPGISSLPRKPLHSVSNSAAAINNGPPHNDETYYTVLWYGYSYDLPLVAELNQHSLGASSPTKSTRPGMVTDSFVSLMALLISETTWAKTWGEQLAVAHCYQNRLYQLEAKRWKLILLSLHVNT